MLFFLLLLETLTETPETTVLARPQGAPYVFYEKEGAEEDIAENSQESNENSTDFDDEKSDDEN